MKHRSRLFVLVVILVALLASAACAQYQTSDKSRFGIGMSVYSPSSTPNIKTTWFAPVIDLHLTYDKDDRPTTYVSLGWFSEGNGGTTATMIPVTVTHIKRFTKSADRAFFIGGGTGLYFTKYSAPNTFLGTFLGNVGANKTLLGVNFMAGYEFSSWFVQLRYDKMASTNNAVTGTVDFSGLSFVIGSRLAL